MFALTTSRRRPLGIFSSSGNVQVWVVSNSEVKRENLNEFIFALSVLYTAPTYIVSVKFCTVDAILTPALTITAFDVLPPSVTCTVIVPMLPAELAIPESLQSGCGVATKSTRKPEPSKLLVREHVASPDGSP